MNAPVVLFVYNRMEHTKKVLEALNQNTGVSETDLYIFSDAPVNEIEAENVKIVRECIAEFKTNNQLRKVEIILAKENKGLEKSIITGVTEVINRYGKVIVLEDDIVTAPDFLEFMNHALNYYKEDNKIWSVSGYNLNTPKIKKGNKDVYIGYRGECWGWASWADRWNKVDWNVSDYNEFVKNRTMQHDFNKGGRDMSYLLKLQQEGKVKSWAIRWNYQQFKEKMLTVFPKYSKAVNIGLDGSGTNCGKQGIENCDFTLEKEWGFQYDLQDHLVSNEFRKSYFKSYMRQALGKYWYLLTEYEYCIGYRGHTNEEYKILKPNFCEWYADPIPFMWKGKKYIFVEVFDKLAQKGYIGVCGFKKNGELCRPEKIIQERFHMSFPNVCAYKGQPYMFPECSESEQIRIYKMGKDIAEWKIYYSFEGVGKIVDSAVVENQDGRVYLLGSVINDDNPYQSRLVLYEIINLDDVNEIKLRKLWEEKEYTYTVRNGGNFFRENDNLYRIVQHSTKDIYGKYVTIKRVLRSDESGIEEIHEKKIDINNQNVTLPAFIYRLWGIHTYGKCEELEVIDLSVQRFSLGGLFMKIYRRLKGL